MRRVVVVGGGAAGMMAAIAAKREDNEVILLEKKPKLGKKIAITGKGRCNITNDCDVEDFVKATVKNGKFLYTAFYSFTNHDVVEFFHNQGLATKVERGQRVFPVTDRAQDVVEALRRAMCRAGVDIRTKVSVQDINVRDGRVTGVVTDSGEIFADAVLLATGGRSYPSTGSDGYGITLAKRLGHITTPLRPCLTSLQTAPEHTALVKRLSGLSLANVSLTLTKDGKRRYDGFGEMLITHKGISGPLVLTASSQLTTEDFPCVAHIDFKPALTNEALDQSLLRRMEKDGDKQVRNWLKTLLPLRAIDAIMEQAKLDPYKRAKELTKIERRRLLTKLKDFTIPIATTGGYGEAVITRGGVAVSEIDPHTMASRKVAGLYFAGEMMDVDAITGGYNLQIAWSTGYLAGSSMAQEEGVCFK